MLQRSIDFHATDTIVEVVLRALFYFGDFDGGLCLSYEDIKDILKHAAEFSDHRLYAALRDDLTNAGPPF